MRSGTIDIRQARNACMKNLGRELFDNSKVS